MQRTIVLISLCLMTLTNCSTNQCTLPPRAHIANATYKERLEYLGSLETTYDSYTKP